MKYGKAAVLVAQKESLVRIVQSGSFKDLYFSEDVLSAVRIADTFIEK
jgi:hypothetical protein